MSETMSVIFWLLWIPLALSFIFAAFEGGYWLGKQGYGLGVFALFVFALGFTLYAFTAVLFHVMVWIS